MITILSSIFCKSLMIPSSKNICSQKVMHDGNEFTFCQRQKVLNQYQVKNELILSQQSNSIFVYTEAVKESNINVKLGRTNVFAVFGFELDDQDIQSSIINVTIDLSIVTGALVCLQCNLSVDSSTLVFAASGQKLSGIMATAGLFFLVSKSLLQFRLDGIYQSGLVNSIQKEMAAFALQDSRMTGYFYHDGDQTGNLVVEVGAKTVLFASGFSICSNSAKDVASASDPAFWIISGSIGQNCQTICESGFVTYGLCLSDLLNGVQSNGQASCQNNFEFDGKNCVCEAGYVLNGSVCINLVGYLTDTTISINGMDNNIMNNYINMEQNIFQSFGQVLQEQDKFFDAINQNISISQIEIKNLLNQTNQLVEIELKNITSKFTQDYEIVSDDLLTKINDSSIQIQDQLLLLQRQITKGKIISYGISDNKLANNTSQMQTKISAVEIQAKTYIYNVDKWVRNYSVESEKRIDRLMRKLKCIQGDCTPLNGYTVTGLGKTMYCVFNSEAPRVCSTKNWEYTVTEPSTCHVRYNSDTSEYDLYTRCCKPQGFWNETSGMCERPYLKYL
ncbi:Growth_factor receptor cysteine-rich domain superfamily [Hexamita inflata]|uniref:Growth_factor receptor cysteine-rich domain superfamily n=1 Tax=Hexamita inflata TaxID=28002 RepID=A0ABP1GLB6_9EUKA